MFITLEGIEGSGKTTVLRGLEKRFIRLGLKTMVTREPGGSKLGLTLRKLLLSSGSRIDPLAELHLFLADRAQHLSETILPALREGYIVLCDRYADSTIAYQAFGRGINLQTVLRQDPFCGLVPDRTLLLTLPVETALARVSSREGETGQDRFDAETEDFHRRVGEGFMFLAGENPERIKIMDASQDEGTVLAACLAALPL